MTDAEKAVACLDELAGHRCEEYADWLKVGMTINKDWQSDSCIGKYLRDIEEQSTPDSNEGRYGGFFWFEGENASMKGHMGQTIVLDRSSGAVLAVHSMAGDYDYKSDLGSILPR